MNITNNEQRLVSLIEQEVMALRNIPLTINYQYAVDLIMAWTSKEFGGKVVTTGMGKAGQVAHTLATTLSSTGTPAVFIHPGEAQHGDLGLVQPSDVIIAISNSGQTREVLEFVTLVHNLHGIRPVISIVGNEESELAKLSQVVLTTGKCGEVCPLGLSPTTSITVMSVISDILVVGLMEERRFSPTEYAKRHHGGYLGKQSREMDK